MAEKLTPADRHFCILLACGYASNMAYQMAFKTKADPNSASAMASRKIASWEIQQLLRLMQMWWNSGKLEFCDHLIKD